MAEKRSDIPFCTAVTTELCRRMWGAADLLFVCVVSDAPYDAMDRPCAYAHSVAEQQLPPRFRRVPWPLLTGKQDRQSLR